MRTDNNHSVWLPIFLGLEQSSMLYEQIPKKYSMYKTAVV